MRITDSVILRAPSLAFILPSLCLIARLGPLTLLCPLLLRLGYPGFISSRQAYYLHEFWASFLSEPQVAGPPEAATPLCSPVTASVSRENGRSKKSVLPAKEVLFQILIPLPSKCLPVRRVSLTIFLFSALWSRVALCSSLGIIPHSCPHANGSAILWAGLVIFLPHQQVLRHPLGAKPSPLDLTAIHMPAPGNNIYLLGETDASQFCFEFVAKKLIQINLMYMYSIKPFRKSHSIEYQMYARNSAKYFIAIASLVHRRHSWAMPYCLHVVDGEITTIFWRFTINYAQCYIFYMY